MTTNGYETYKQNSVTTVSPGKLLLMAYDGAIKFCKMTDESLSNNDFSGLNEYGNRAIAIVCELISTLRDDVDPVLAQRLKSLYTYIIDKISESILLADPSGVNEAEKILKELRETWAQAEESLRNESLKEAAA
ncbi:MAG: flagellar export chaperone FliS [Armatimonadota bacterium]